MKTKPNTNQSVEAFRKRTFTPASFAGSALEVGGDLPKVPFVLGAGGMEWAFAEKIMLAVTSVNQCRYCTWMHSGMAETAGADTKQIEAILSGPGSKVAVSDYELPAIEYAWHYAETNRRPHPDRTADLIRFYGAQRAGWVQMFIRLIYFGNLSGNTFDAFLHRLRGGRIEGDDHPLFQMAFGAAAAVPLMAIGIIFDRQKEKVPAF